jgi:hypothetical protein
VEDQAHTIAIEMRITVSGSVRMRKNRWKASCSLTIHPHPPGKRSEVDQDSIIFLLAIISAILVFLV